MIPINQMQREKGAILNLNGMEKSSHDIHINCISIKLAVGCIVATLNATWANPWNNFQLVQFIFQWAGAHKKKIAAPYHWQKSFWTSILAIYITLMANAEWERKEKKTQSSSPLPTTTQRERRRWRSKYKQTVNKTEEGKYNIWVSRDFDLN